MKRAVVGIVVIAVVFSGAAVANGERPIASATIDQDTDHENAIHIDSSLSVDTDGEIVEREWTITLPDGTDSSPRCLTCTKTEFTPEVTGTYEVTVTVTDNDGNQASDTLLMEVTSLDTIEFNETQPGRTRVSRDRLRSAILSNAGADGLSTYGWRMNADRVVGPTPFVEWDGSAPVEATGQIEIGPSEDRFTILFPVTITSPEWQKAVVRDHPDRASRVPVRVVDDQFSDPAGLYVDVLTDRFTQSERERIEQGELTVTGEDEEDTTPDVVDQGSGSLPPDDEDDEE